jgi:hypothetical protein
VGSGGARFINMATCPDAVCRVLQPDSAGPTNTILPRRKATTLNNSHNQRVLHISYFVNK